MPVYGIWYMVSLFTALPLLGTYVFLVQCTPKYPPFPLSSSFLDSPFFVLHSIFQTRLIALCREISGTFFTIVLLRLEPRPPL
jgi:hypothetical protein